MGSRTFNGVRFSAYPLDHAPPHVHGFYAELEIIVELLLTRRGVQLAEREDAVRPPDAKRSDVRRTLRAAQTHYDELLQLWREAHP